MATDPTFTELRPSDETWQEIEDLIQQIAGLSASERPPQEFYAELLSGAVQALAAAAGAVWMRNAKGRLHLEYQINIACTELADDDNVNQRHGLLLDTIVNSRQTRIVAPHSGSGDDQSAANPTEFLLVICPIVVADEVVGLIEVFQRAETSQAAQQGYLRFVSALGELAADFHRNRQLRQLKDRSGVWGQFEQFAEQVHASLDLNKTAYVIVNEGLRIAGCDRLSVVMVRGRSCRLVAMSGLDRVDRRSNAVRRLEKLTRAIVKTDEPFWYIDDPSGLPPQIETPLQDYVDESHARTLAVIPLKEAVDARKPERRPKTICALVVERFDTDRSLDSLQQRAEPLAKQSELAMRNALEYKSIPFLPLLRLLRKLTWFFHLRRLPLTMLVLGALVAAGIALVVVPADFEIEGTGELQPEIRRNVYARSDGIVNKLDVSHLKRVSAGDVLVVLRKTELDYEFSRVLGEMQTTAQRLETIKTSRLQLNPTDPMSTEKFNRLTAEEKELKLLLDTLKEQHEILKEQRTDLAAISPIDGSILDWKVDDLLESRPVQRGQKLVTVADLDGPWLLEMRVPDDRIGHILDAQKELGPKLKVTFILEMDPDVEYTGEIQEIAMSTEVDESVGATVLVTVRFDRDQIPRLRPGAIVIPKVYCGRRPVGYVWFHDILDTIKTRLLF